MSITELTFSLSTKILACFYPLGINLDCFANYYFEQEQMYVYFIWMFWKLKDIKLGINVW